MGKHTSGPWGITEDGDYIRQVNGGRRLYVAAVIEIPIKGETQANARLLAAAPELLEAAEAVNAGCVNSSTVEDGERRFTINVSAEAFRMLQAAIAKAEGRDE